MKKILSLILALAMVMSLSVTAFAAEGSDGGNKPGEDTNIDVSAKHVAGGSTGTVYSVDIKWTDMTFTYTDETTKTWKPEDHSYETNPGGSWDKTTATVTVTNHSNAGVTATVAYTDGNANDGVNASFDKTTATLDAGVENQYDAADKEVFTLTIEGTPTFAASETAQKIGSIKVTLAAA